MPSPPPLHQCIEDMGNSVGCVRKPKEPGPGKGKDPHSVKKRRRFRRKKKGHSREEQDQGGSQKEMRVETEDIFNICTVGEAVKSPSGSLVEEGRVLQVREMLQGEVKRAILLDPMPVRGSPPAGTTVIARILDNPADRQQGTFGTVVDFDRAGKSRAILLPLKGELLGDAVSTGTSPGADTNSRFSSPLMQLVQHSQKAKPQSEAPVTQSWGPDLSSSGYCSDPSSQLAQVGLGS
ncbi:uncharacterized protein WCC33_000034 [Rhinophrynus dorsalis]